MRSTGTSLPLWLALITACTASSLIPFPEGQAPDGTRYKTAYECEGDQMSISCDPEETIQVIRANYGRFSIAVCNKHGYTEWSVNCIAQQTTWILQRRCDGEQNCSLPVNSNIFGGDPCPGTRKYVEVHYACISKHSIPGDLASTTKGLPPWLLEGRADDLWNEEAEAYDGYEYDNAEPPVVRKPILIQLSTTPKATTTTPLRIPITTPKSTTTVSTTTTAPDATTQILTDDEAAHNVVLDEVNTLERVSSPMEHMDIFSSDVHAAQIEGQACPPRFFRYLYWNWTQAGQTAILPCPKGSTGLASWHCGPDADWSTPHPDLGDCKSAQMSNLEVAVRKEDPEEVIVSKLVHLTAPPSRDAISRADDRPLFGGDLEAAVGILESVANRLQYKLQSWTRDQSSNVMYNKQSHVQQIFQNVLRASSQLLSDANREVVWADLKNASRVKMASELMRVVEAHAFLLAEVIPDGDAGEVITETTREISMSLSVIDTGVSSRGSRGGRQQAFHGFVNDSIELPGPDANPAAANQPILRTVFFSYQSLHDLFRGMADPNGQTYELNSRIISASFLKGRRALEDPVRIRFNHLNEVWEGGESGNKCVFWDQKASTWSEQGCQVVETSANATTCACKHLTSFALLSPQSRVGVARAPTAETSTTLLMEIVICLLAVIFIIILVLIPMRYRRVVFKHCCAGANKSDGCCSFCLSYRERCHHHQSETKNKPPGPMGNNNGDTGDKSQMKLNMATTRGAVAVPAHQLHPQVPPHLQHLATIAHPSRHQAADPRPFTSVGGLDPRPPLHQSMGELSTLPHTTLRRPPKASPTQQPQHTIIVNPFQFSPKHRPTLPRPVDNYSRGSRAQESTNQGYPLPPTPVNLRYAMSPQLARLTNTLRHNSDSMSPISTRDLSSSTASYQNISTELSELPDPDLDTLSQHVYCEIPAFAAEKTPPPVSTAPKPVFPPKKAFRRPIQTKKKLRANPLMYLMDSEDGEDTASDLHNLTDFSEDEDKVVETSNSDVSGQSTSSSSMGQRQRMWPSPSPKPRGQLKKSALARDEHRFNPAEFDFNGKVTII